MAENRHPSREEHDVHLPDLNNPNVGHEVVDVDEWAVGKFGIALVLICIAVLALLFGIFHFFLQQSGGPLPSRVEQGVEMDARSEPPQPRLQPSDILDMEQMRAAENQILNSYGWVDQGSGTVRIPIDRAMEILAQRGLPARPDNGPQSAAANVTVPSESGLGPVMNQIGGPLAGELSGSQAAAGSTQPPANPTQQPGAGTGNQPSAPPAPGGPHREGVPGTYPANRNGVPPYSGGTSNTSKSKSGK
ncbi:MAG TPA: hypothetical protein VN736_16965 [Candidatus Limnocylindrales bacterium]|nr:hypothetical protein [Candidatus Limnocylindrales bacterium]